MNCDNCKMCFETKQELINHQNKFCINSGYTDISKLDNQMTKLRNSPVKDGSTILEATTKQLMEKDFHKREKYDQEKQIVGLIRELQQDKQAEMVANIEREEIARAIRNQSNDQLGKLGNEKRKDLENLSKQRELVRVQEQRLQDEVAEMEGQLFSQEQKFKIMESNAENQTIDVKNATLKEVRAKEMEYVTAQASSIAKIKVERDRLHLEREKIMHQLDKVKNNPNRQSAVRRAGQDIMQDKPASSYSNRPVDEAFRRKVIEDEARLNHMKQMQAQARLDVTDEINDIDVMYNEIKLKPDLHQSVKKLAKQFSSAENPNHISNMYAINQRLTQEINNKQYAQMDSPAPAHIHNTQQQPSNDMMGKMNELEQIMLGSPMGQKKNSIVNASPLLHQQHQSAKQEKLFPMGQQTQRMLNNTIDPQAVYQSQFIPPQPGFQQQTIPGFQQSTINTTMPQQSPMVPYIMHPQGSGSITDPALAQLAQMLDVQDKENQKLKNVLENFGKNFSTQDELEGIIQNQSTKLNNMAHGGPMMGMQNFSDDGMTYNPMNQSYQMEGGVTNYPLPENFMFRQNDDRSSDMEVEERALMNLASQEIDQIRVLQKLPRDSDLYRHKLKQFRDISAMRTEVEKVLQEQRLEKIQRDYQRQKVDEERALNHQDWIEKQKMAILEGRLEGEFGVQQVQLQEHQMESGSQQHHHDQYDQSDSFKYDDNSQRQSQGQGERPKQHDNIEINDLDSNKQNLLKHNMDQKSNASSFKHDMEKYNENVGLVTNIDLVHGIPRRIRTLKVVFSGFHGSTSIDEAKAICGPETAEQDHIDKNLNKVIFKGRQLMTGLPDSDKSKIVFELHAVDSTQPQGFATLGWTWINLFRSDYKFNSGKFQLPVYSGETKPDQTEGQQGLEKATGVSICIRIGLPGDDVLTKHKIDHRTGPGDYVIPKYHISGKNQQHQQEQQAEYGGGGDGEKQHDSRKQQIGDEKEIMRNAKLVEKNQVELIYPDSADKPVSEKENEEEQNENDAELPENGKIVKDLRYNCIGIRVRLHYALLGKPYENFQVKLTLLDDDEQVLATQNANKLCEFSSQMYQNKSYDRIKTGQYICVDKEGSVLISKLKDKVPKNQEPLKRDRMVRIIDDIEQLWERNFYVDYIYKPTSKYVTVELIGTSLGGNTRLQTVAFAFLELNSIKTGKIKYGFNRLQLYEAPLNFGKKGQKLKEMKDEFIGMTILDPIIHRKSLKELLNADRPLTGQSQQFIPNFKETYNLADRFNPIADQFDIYIDGARHLPENVTMTKIVVRIVDSDLKDLMPPSEYMADIASSFLRTQFYRCRIAFKLKQVVSTALLYIQMETYSQSSRLPKIVGVSCFPLFMDAVEKMPCTTVRTNAAPITGAFQMAMYHKRVNEQKPFTYEKFVFQSRVPACSILFRILKVPFVEQGAQNTPFVKAPSYKSGIYNTMYYSTTNEEKKIMDLRGHRQKVPLQNIVDNVAITEQTNPDAIDSLEFMTKLIITTKDTGLINLNYHSQFEPQLGFRFNVMCLYNNKIQGFPCFLASVMPTAQFYDLNRKSRPNDAFVFSKPDLSSHQQQIKIDDGDQIIRGFVPFKSGMSILIDVRMYMPDTDKFQTLGFTICPLLQDLDIDGDADSAEYFVNSGNFSLPLYAGSVDQELIDRLLESSEPMKIMEMFLERGKIELLDKTSIVVKIVDQQRSLHFHEPIDKELPSNQFMPPQLKDSHTYDPIVKTGFFGAKFMKDILPSQYQMNPNSFVRDLDNKFKAELLI